MQENCFHKRGRFKQKKTGNMVNDFFMHWKCTEVEIDAEKMCSKIICSKPKTLRSDCNLSLRIGFRGWVEGEGAFAKL